MKEASHKRSHIVWSCKFHNLETASKWVIAWGSGWEQGLTIKGIKGLITGWNILKLNYGDGCTTQ